jgi:hypothetical protein
VMKMLETSTGIDCDYDLDGVVRIA